MGDTGTFQSSRMRFYGTDPGQGTLMRPDITSITLQPGPEIVLTWSNVTGATSYGVERATNLLSGFSLLAGGLLQTVYTDGMANAESCLYRVKAE